MNTHTTLWMCMLMRRIWVTGKLWWKGPKGRRMRKELSCWVCRWARASRRFPQSWDFWHQSCIPMLQRYLGTEAITVWHTANDFVAWSRVPSDIHEGLEAELPRIHCFTVYAWPSDEPIGEQVSDLLYSKTHWKLILWRRTMLWTSWLLSSFGQMPKPQIRKSQNMYELECVCFQLRKLILNHRWIILEDGHEMNGEGRSWIIDRYLSVSPFAHYKPVLSSGDWRREIGFDLFEFGLAHGFLRQVTHHSLLSYALLLLKCIACLIVYAWLPVWGVDGLRGGFWLWGLCLVMF